MSEEIAFAGAAEQARMVREGEVSPVELVELCLQRIERLDPGLNAFRVVFSERARAEAKAAQRSFKSRKTEGRAERLAREKPLFGVPVALKDQIDLEGEVTMNGTDAFDQPAAVDSDMAVLLREAGAILIGKTHLPELAICGFTESATWGVTRNPWDDQHSSGGSSGGSATAVAAGMVPIASASDGAGSIRLPASSCGLFGLKPQRDRVPMGPGVDHWNGLSVNGCVSRTVADTALWLDVTLDRSAGESDKGAGAARAAGGGVAGERGGAATGADSAGTAPPAPPERPYTEIVGEDPGKLRIAWSVSPPRAVFPPQLFDDARSAVDSTARLLAELGHTVERRDPEWGRIGESVTPRYLRGIATDVDAVPHPERLERRTRGFGRLGRLIPRFLMDRALQAAVTDGERIGKLFESHDVLITPVMAGPAIPVRRWEGQGALRTLIGMSRYYPYCVPWNHLGNPAASVPAGFTADGLPLAVQLIARPGDEATLLRLAAQLERERPWADRRPPLATE